MLCTAFTTVHTRPTDNITIITINISQDTKRIILNFHKTVHANYKCVYRTMETEELKF